MFVRQKLLAMREKLPNIEMMRQAMRKNENLAQVDGKKTRWWNRWFHRNGDIE